MTEKSYLLLNEIHKYYPVGLPYKQSTYPGFKKAMVIVKNKINLLILGKKIEPWNTFIDILQESFKQEKFFDLCASQFPSLSFIIILRTTEDLFIERRTKLNLSLSLLCPYFTVYIEEEIIVSPKNGEIPSITTFKFHRRYLTGDEVGKIEKVKFLAEKYYPRYTFINYELLSEKVKGVIPIDEDPQSIITEFSMYDLLFGKS